MAVVLEVAVLLACVPVLTEPSDGSVSRLLWIDPPHVDIKAELVYAVVRSVGGRVAEGETLGCCVAVGDRSDLDVAEHLASSLLVQATTALRYRGGNIARTALFDRSFLASYSYRIEQRLGLMPESSSDDEPLPEADPEGWVAGRAAADVALLEALPDLGERVTRRR
ncbi:hypothetical protein [Nocardioides sp. 503]|uniref:hypothetical protein n=1 Tax=Nocardioides sp. 503 TaxID=2508326 RepID=UPI00106F2C9C|nr:hypothetical protein [Nocardioides sp. 503]